MSIFQYKTERGDFFAIEDDGTLWDAIHSLETDMPFSRDGQLTPEGLAAVDVLKAVDLPLMILAPVGYSPEDGYLEDLHIFLPSVSVSSVLPAESTERVEVLQVAGMNDASGIGTCFCRLSYQSTTPGTPNTAVKSYAYAIPEPLDDGAPTLLLGQGSGITSTTGLDSLACQFVLVHLGPAGEVIEAVAPTFRAEDRVGSRVVVMGLETVDENFLRFMEYALPTVYDPYNKENEPGTHPGGHNGGNGDRRDPAGNIDFPPVPGLSAVATGFVNAYVPTGQQLSDLATYLWNQSWLDLSTWQKWLIGNPFQAVIGLQILPFTVPTSGSEVVQLGSLNTGISMPRAASQWHILDFGTLPLDEYWQNYLDYAPYSKYQIYLPYIGVRELNTDDIIREGISNPIELKYYIDILSGACVAMLKSAGTLLYQFAGSCATAIPITANDHPNMLHLALQTAVAGVSAIATGGTTLAAAAPGLVASGVSAAKETVLRSGAIGNTAGILACQNPYLIVSHPQAINAQTATYKAQTGYPSFRYQQLKTLSGYTECEVVHADGIPGTSSELDEIENLLRSGVILNAPQSYQYNTPPAGTFAIILTRTLDDKRVLSKRIQPNMTTQLNGVLKESTSILDPIILFECNLTDVALLNYMLIPAFGRYYHITGIRSIRAGLVEVSAHVDVLGTYATEIRELSAIIHRQENSWDLYFNDGILRTRQNPIVYTYPFTTGFSGNSYVFACAGKMD